MLVDVVKVQVEDHYALLLEFENAERLCFDMAPRPDHKPRLRIKPEHRFSRSFIENGTVAWPGNIDIAPETLYDHSIPVEPCHP